MKFVTLHNGEKLPVIGLGTWAMGGQMTADPTQDERALKAMRYALEIGYTHIDTAEMYAAGHTEELLGQAIRGYDRKNLFITTKVLPSNLRYSDVHRALEGSLERLGTDYVDLYLVHWLNPGIKLGETFKALNELAASGKVRHVGVSNFNLAELKEAQSLCATQIVTNQVPYSVATREYVHNGVVDYCQANQVVITAYSPVEVGKLKANPTLEKIAMRHNITPYQAAMAWLVQQPWVITIPMSHHPKHLEDNLAAADIALTPEEMAELTSIR